jgi:uncharacterized protein (DUF58 family)
MIPSVRMISIVAAVGFPAAAVAALAPAWRLASFAALACLAIVICADALIRRSALAGIRVELPELVRFFKDHAGEVRVRIHNESKHASTVRVGIVAPQGLETAAEEQTIRLPEGAESAEFVWQWMPLRRGQYRIASCFLEGASPLGMWAVRQEQPVSCEIRVYPNLRRKDDLRALQRGAGGLHTMRQIGRGREFEKLREYLPGDGFDEIHWKATARRGHPITKVYQVERTQEVYAVLDASRLSGRAVGGETMLERMISAALIVGAAAERRGDLFGLAAFSHQVEGFVRARNGKAHYAACRDAV